MGQGALAIECRENDKTILDLIAPLQDHSTLLLCRAERSFMRSLEGGCSVPLGVFSSYDSTNKTLSLTGAVFSLDGSESLKCKLNDNITQPEDADALGDNLAEILLNQGAGDILRAARNTTQQSGEAFNPQQPPSNKQKD